MGTRTGVIVAVVLAGSICSCGGDSDGGGGGGDQPDGSPGTYADAAADDAAPDAMLPDAMLPDAAPDAAPGGMVITAVVLDGGFHQVHQGTTLQLVISGSGLGEVTDVIVTDGGILSPGDLVVTPTEVRVTMFLFHGAAPGPRDVTLVAPAGSATSPAAFAVTPWVLGPGAAAGGRATFESPLLLAEYSEGAGFADTMLFLAGEHLSDGAPLTEGSITIMGQGAATTVVRFSAGAGGFDTEAGGPAPSALRDLTIQSEDGAPGYRAFGAGSLAISDVKLVGGGISVTGPADTPRLNVTAARLAFDGQGAGDGFRASGAVDAAVADSNFIACGAGGGIVAEEAVGTLAVDGVVVKGCARGIAARAPRQDFITLGLDVQVTASQIIDNDTGIDLFAGIIGISGVVIADDQATMQASRTGIQVGAGSLTVADTTISGQVVEGVRVLSSLDISLGVTLRRVQITGGQLGVESTGFPDDIFVGLRDCVIRDQTAASVRIDNDGSIFDFGNDGTGGNQLSVVSGGTALEDLRDDPFPSWETIPTEGMTLNGNSLAGQLIEGPVEAPPDYRIVGTGSFQF